MKVISYNSNFIYPSYFNDTYNNTYQTITSNLIYTQDYFYPNYITQSNIYQTNQFNLSGQGILSNVSQLKNDASYWSAPAYTTPLTLEFTSQLTNNTSWAAPVDKVGITLSDS